MTKRRENDPAETPGEPTPEADDFDAFAPPDDLDEPAAPARKAKRPPATTDAGGGDVELDFGLGGPPPPAKRPFPKVAIVVAVVVVVVAALLAYRTVSRRKALRTAVAQAELDVRLDTADGYRKAAQVLAPFADQDPVEAAGLRAYALGMLALDYRDAAAVDEAEGLLVKPERADPIPRWGNLARAAVALSKGEAGTAMTAASRVAGDPIAGMLEGRIALAAGNLEAALEPLHAAAAAEPPLPAALALHGDAVRRSRRDYRAAQAAYTRALASSGEHVHPRAAFGLAKLALVGHVPPVEATIQLDRLMADKETPANERGRAALHAAALAIKAGDRVRAGQILDGAGLDAAARDWANRAAALEGDTGRIYRAVDGAPASILSASDDDPPELPPVAIAPPPPPPAPRAEPPKVTRPTARKATAKTATKATATSKKKPATKKATTSTRKPTRR
jgi:tetratricopeptide (TPR) repeat protein